MRLLPSIIWQAFEESLGMNNRLGLGTVQFGLAYGIANQVGQVSGVGAAEILGLAWAAGVNTLDTAIGYGNSESILGKIGVLVK